MKRNVLILLQREREREREGSFWNGRNKVKYGLVVILLPKSYYFILQMQILLMKLLKNNVINHEHLIMRLTTQNHVQ